VEFEDKRDAEDAVRVSFLFILAQFDLRLEAKNRFKAAGHSVRLILCSHSRVGIKKPTQKTQPKKPKKTHTKKPTKNGFFRFFLGFLKFLIYENNTNFSLSDRFFMNK
jgi:hypothetical protein